MKPAEPAQARLRARALPVTGQGSWLRDFRFRGRGLEVLTTGVLLKVDRTLLREALIWLVFHAAVRLRGWWMAATSRSGPAIWFSPHRPRPWYMVWSALTWAGGRVAPSPEQADAVFAFEDATWTAGDPVGARRVFNAGCRDVSKSRVAAVFEEVFGYPLEIDPTTWRGPAVEKSELNGAHDGVVVQCPTTARPGRCYQRLIDTADGDFAYDLRTPCVGGRPVAVWVKRKHKDARFAVHNLSATTRRPEEVFSAAELEQIGRFLSAMAVDWAGLDILRDRPSGRIYIVDVNKTDVGPIIALPFIEKMRATVTLAGALTAMIGP